ncbi:MAG: metallopeptidase TldD-related protein [Bdellovibrionales bacterium]
MKYDLLSIRDHKSTLKVEAGRPHSRKNVEIERFGIRRFENGRIYQASRLGKSSLDRLLDDTREWGGPGLNHEYGFAPHHVEVRRGKKVELTVFDQFLDSLRSLQSQFPQFVFSGRCQIQSSVTTLNSNYGLALEVSGDLCDWYFVYQRRDSGNMLDGFFGETTSCPDVQAMIQKQIPFLKVEHKEESLKPGRLPVLFIDPLQPISKLVDSLHVHKYFEGAGLYSGRLGESLFDSRISLVDAGYDPIRGPLTFFDGEGTVRSQDWLKVVDQGVLVDLLSDLRFGKKYGRPSTGNGMRSCRGGVMLAPRSLRFAPGKRPWKDILSGLDRCLVVIVAAGGDSNDLGEYSTPVQVGFIFEKGEVIGRAPQVTVKTSVADYLGNSLIDVSSDGFDTSSVSPCLISEMDIYS